VRKRLQADGGSSAFLRLLLRESLQDNTNCPVAARYRHGNAPQIPMTILRNCLLETTD
jgi:hypothetical protein